MRGNANRIIKPDKSYFSENTTNSSSKSNELYSIQLTQPSEISGARTVCQGSTETYSISPVIGASGYTWTMPDGISIVSGQGTTSVIVSISDTANEGQRNISVRAYNSLETSQNRDKTIEFKRQSIAPTTITINNIAYTGQSICYDSQGQTNNIHMKVSGGDKGSNGTIRWYTESCYGSYLSNAEQIDANITAGSSKTFYVSYKGDCNETECIAVTINTNSGVGETIGSISGPNNVCKNSNNITYTVPTVTNAESYTWTLPPGATPITGTLQTTTNSITVNYLNASSGQVTVIAKGAGDCGGVTNQASLEVTTTNPLTTPTFINANTDVCVGSIQTFTVTEIPDATSYNWTVPLGATITSGSGTHSITVDLNTALAGNITAQAINSCGTSNITTLPLTLKTVPSNPTAITGPNIVCAGETMVAYEISEIINATSYQWSISNGSATFNGSSSSNSIVLDISNTPLANFTISAVGVNDCGESSINTELLVNINERSVAPTTITSSNSNTICEGTSTTLNVSGGTLGTGAIIEWYSDSCGGTPVGTGNNILVSPTSSTTYFARYNGICNITACTSTTINVDPLPDSAGALTGINVVCQGENNIEYSVPSIPNATHYIWTLPTGASIVSGEGTNTIEVNYDIFTAISGVITVQGQNDCGTGTISANYGVTVNPKPIISVNLPSQTICSTDAILPINILNDNSVAGISYSWTRDNTTSLTGIASSGTGASINGSLSNNTNNPITTTFTITATANGCSSQITASITVNPTPTVSATNTLQNICYGDNITPIVISNPNNIAGVTYSWTRNNTTGLTGLESGTSATISGALVNTTNSPQTTTFTITALANGCEGETITATITVNPELVISINPDLRPDVNQTVCSDTEITPIEILNDNNLENVEYYWERTDRFSVVKGLESGTGSSISGTLQNTDYRNRIITFKIWAVANGCISNVIEDIQIRIIPTPIVEVTPIEQTICNEGTISMAIGNTYNTNNTTYSWTRDNTSNVTGIAPSGTGNAITGTLTNTTTETQTVTFTITATRLKCSTTTTATVIVYAPLSTPVIANSQTVCWGESPTDLYLNDAITGGSGNYNYQWQYRQNENNGSWSTIGNGNTTSPNNSGFYRLSVSDNECSTILYSNIIEIEYVGIGGVTDQPKITNAPSTTEIYCPGDPISPTITIEHYASSIEYAWASNASYFTPATGVINGNRSGGLFTGYESTATINATLKNNGNNTIITSFYITPIYDFFIGPECYSDPIELPLQIYPTPKILSITASENEICSGSSADIIVDGNITDNPMEFSWTRNETTNVLGDSSGESGIISQNGVYTLNNVLTNTTSSPKTVTYTITPKSTTGCGSGTPVTYSVIVQPFIAAEASLISTIDSCDDTTVQLSANTNISGTWTALPLGGVFSDITDPNATFTGESGTNYTLTWTVVNESLCGESSKNVTVNIPACTGNDFNFNGTNTSVNFGNNYNLNGPFSIEIWAKPNTTSGQQTLFSKRSATSTTSGYDLTLNGGSIAFNYNNGTSIYTTGLTTNRWYHIAVTYSGSVYKLYIDGILKATQNGDGPQSNSSLALLGAKQSTLLPTNYYNGWLDELRIWNTALSEDQIREMMNQEIQNNGGKVRGAIIPLDITGNLDWNTNLVGYYQMGSNILNGTLTSVNGAASGTLRNMTSKQQETAPLPYETNGNSNWDSAAAWMNADVNQIPNSSGITWNIVKIKNNITLDRTTTVLGLIVEDNTLTVPDNSPLTVSKYLKLDGTLKLEGEAQLLQPENSIVDYTGTGELHLDQQGTTNIYNYNYWASPVSTSGTTSNRTYKLNEVLHTGTTPVRWTTNSDGAPGNPPFISTRWLYLFENYNTTTFNWHKIDEDYDINVGLGYIMKGASNADYTFIGQPNNGDYLVNVSAGNDALVGNPYPSAIDANTFITDNQVMLNDGGNNGEIRFWRQSTTNNSHATKEYLGGYASLNLTGGNPAVAPADISGIGDADNYIPKRYIPVAQGFFITAGQAGNIIFNNGQRIYKTETDGSSIFLRTDGTDQNDDNDVQRIRLNFKNPDNATRQLLLGFTPDNAATDDVDFGYDATNFESISSDLLFLINDNTYVIQGVGAFDETKQYPLALFMGKDGNIEITLNTLENFDTDIDVFIYDSYENTYTKVNNSKYQIHLDKGAYTDRYFVAFKEENRLDIIEDELRKLSVNYLGKTDEIYITSPSHITIKQVQLINILGQTVRVWNATNATLTHNCKIPVKQVSEGNYIVKVQTDQGNATKKLSIKY
ncbi:PKD-like domain-containing protein [Formosa sediminum]|uniref:PKD-like domain-containing protein n=1 Tax=Formosa sediminum TaxID=2594004 RepID=UPI00163D785D|nr:PKD-like domain-containing protein [Formosa sediminum]